MMQHLPPRKKRERVVVFIHKMADKNGALAISSTIVILTGKHGVFHSSLILIPDVDDPVGVVSEEQLAPPVVLLPVFFLGGRCRGCRSCLKTFFNNRYNE